MLSPLELTAVLDLHHLVRCVEVKYCHYEVNEDFDSYEIHERWPVDREPPPPLSTAEEPEGMGVWRERFHAAAYMSLLMGAVFARAYNQPFYPDNAASLPDHGADQCRRELFDLLRKAPRREPPHQQWRHGAILQIKEKEREYLRRFPVFDLNDELGGQKAVLDPFIEWFIRSSLLKHRAGPLPSSRSPWRDEVQAAVELDSCLDLPGPTDSDQWPEDGGPSHGFIGGTPAEGEAVLWDTMQSIHMFEFILSCVANSDGKLGLGRHSDPSVGSSSGKTRTARVVLFGVFQAEDILMPGHPLDSADQQLLAQTPQRSSSSSQAHPEPTASPPILDIPTVLEDLYMRSGIHNVNHRDNAPPPPLQLFTFILKHHFKVEFKSSIFGTWWRDHQFYYAFKNRATIFANGPKDVAGRALFDYTNGTEILVEYQSPAFSYVCKNRGNPRVWVPEGLPF